MSNLTLAEANKMVGQTFKLIIDEDSPDHVHDVVVDSVKEGKALPDFPGKVRDTSFSMLFTCKHHCEQKTHLLRHETLGDHEIYLTPVVHDRGSDVVMYQAVFS